MPGWLAGQPSGEWTLDGDESIRRRPVDRIAEPLRRMGADVDCRDGRLPPLRVRGSALTGINYEMPVASAQVKSCLLLAGLLAEGETTIHEPYWTRDHTERMLAAAGADIRRDGGRVTVSRAERLEAGDVPVPGDFSSAAFLMVAALLVPGSEVSLREVGINRARIGLLSILSRMGVEMGAAHDGDRAMTVDEIREPGPEPIATLIVRHAPLSGATVTRRGRPIRDRRTAAGRPARLLRRGRDGRGAARRSSAPRSRTGSRGSSTGSRRSVQRSRRSRTASLCEGTGGLRGGMLDARGDHRLAMLGAIAGLASQEGVEVEGFESVAVSYPRFERDLRSLLG